MNHKCDGCKYKGEHQEMMFKPFSVCRRISDLVEAEKAYKADKCPFDKGNTEYCVSCGSEIPEGRQICPECQMKVKPETLESYSRTHETLKEKIKKIADSMAYTMGNSIQAINDYNEMMSAENILSSVSSYDFVFGFRPIAKLIAESQIEPFKDTYVSLCHEASEMLCSGVDQSDVLWFFEKQLYPKKEVHRNEMPYTAKTHDGE